MIGIKYDLIGIQVAEIAISGPKKVDKVMINQGHWLTEQGQQIPSTRPLVFPKGWIGAGVGIGMLRDGRDSFD